MEDLDDWPSTVGMTTKRPVGKGLKDFELVSAFLTAVFICGHDAIYHGY